MNHRNKYWIILVGLALLLTLSACGQKGDLYLPDKNAQTAEIQTTTTA